MTIDRCSIQGDNDRTQKNEINKQTNTRRTQTN